MLPLWRFTHRKSKRKNVTALKWHPVSAASQHLSWMMIQMHVTSHRGRGIQNEDKVCSGAEEKFSRRTMLCVQKGAMRFRFKLPDGLHTICRRQHKAVHVHCRLRLPRRLQRNVSHAELWHPDSEVGIVQVHFDLFAVGYGSFDYMKQTAGAVEVYTLKNLSAPEFQISVDVGEQKRHFFHTSCIDAAVSTSGSVCTARSVCAHHISPCQASTAIGATARPNGLIGHANVITRLHTISTATGVA